MPERFLEFLWEAGEQIRWKNARKPLLEELQTHLMEELDGCLAEGMEEQAAEAEALRRTGDPVVIGAELDAVHRPRPQWGALLLVFLYAAAAVALRLWLIRDLCGGDLSAMYSQLSVMKNMAAPLVGLGVMLLLYRLDYTVVIRREGLVYLGAVILSLLYLHFSPHTMYRSYYTQYVVLFFPVVYAVWLYSLRRKGWLGMLAALGGGIPLTWICLRVPYVAGTLMLLFTGFFLLLMLAWQDWFGIGRRWGVALSVSCGAVLAVTAACSLSRRRWDMLFHPEMDPWGAGYQAMSVRNALSGVQLWGQAAWNGTHSYAETVPEWSGDFWLTSLAFRLGWLPAAAVVTVLAGLLIWLLLRALRLPNRLGSLVASAVAVSLLLQTAGTVSANLGYILCGITFPLCGRIFVVTTMAQLGLALSAFRQEQLPISAADTKRESLFHPHRPFLSWQDGDLVIALGKRSKA